MAREPAGFGDIFDLTFQKFVTPTVISVLFILVIVFGALGWIAAIFAGFAGSFWGGIWAIVLGGLFFFIIVLLYRVLFEIVMVVFRIEDNTERTADALDRGGNA